MLDSAVKKTPLYDAHVELGAKMVPFAGFQMPVRYSELRQEHEAVRNVAGLFDVSHMGEFYVEGPDSLDFLQYVTCNDVSQIEIGQAQYNAFLNEKGGVVDDLIIYRMDQQKYFLCVNASNTTKDFAWCQQHTSSFENLSLRDASSEYAQIAIQGPKAEEVFNLLPSLSNSTKNLSYFKFCQIDSDYGKLIIARTGYTGEDGFEIFIDPTKARALWNDLIEYGSPLGLLPCGLGARDTLRLEACYPLHGHELSEDVSALESGLSWIVKLKKSEFLGQATLKQEKKSGIQKKLVGFFVESKGIVREGAVVCNLDGESIGQVTSGTLTPTLDRALGLMIIDAKNAEPGKKLKADVRGRKLDIVVAKTPFYKKPKS